MGISSRYVGPYSLTSDLRPTAVRLYIPPSLKVHHVFHVSLFKPVVTGQSLPLVGPILPPWALTVILSTACSGFWTYAVGAGDLSTWVTGWGPVSCLHSGNHLHSSKNITSRTNQAQQFTLQLWPVPTPCSLPMDSPSRTSCARQPTRFPTLSTDLLTWTLRRKPSRNKPLHRRPYLPAFLSDQHQLQVPAPTSNNHILAP
ncbi:hypothetical protein CRENBAI_006955, partial [Crenichthys baileyi]